MSLLGWESSHMGVLPAFDYWFPQIINPAPRNPAPLLPQSPGTALANRESHKLGVQTWAQSLLCHLWLCDLRQVTSPL